MAGECIGRYRVKHILVDAHKVPLKNCAFSLPWKSDSICMNFDMPEEVIVPDEIPLLNKEEVESMVIGCVLDDYTVLKEFRNLRELYVCKGEKVDDISFVENMTGLKQFALHGSKIHSIHSLVTLLEKKKEMIGTDSLNDWLSCTMEGICVSSDQKIVDRDDLIPYRRYCSEIILNGESLFR